MNYGVHHLLYDPSTFSLFSGVSKIGVCKWLFYSESMMQPELSYVYPLTQGNNLFKFIIKQGKAAKQHKEKEGLQLQKSIS